MTLYCPFCMKPFQSFSFLKAHYQLRHMENPYKCAVCGYNGGEISVIQHYSHQASRILEGDYSEWVVMHAVHYVLSKFYLHRSEKARQVRNLILQYLTTYPPRLPIVKEEVVPIK